jgi:hypothetical protein
MEAVPNTHQMELPDIRRKLHVGVWKGAESVQLKKL